MKDIISILKKYFSEKDINKLVKSLEDKQRCDIINDYYFAKLGKNIDKLFFNNLVKEIRLYENNKDNDFLPSYVDSFVSNNYCLIVLKKINGKTLSNERNNYSTHLSHNKRLLIAIDILNIKNIKVNYKLDNDYSRKVKLDKYLEESKKYLSTRTYLKINSLYNYLIKESKNTVISHGDLIPTNIIVDKKEVYFIDWEYISLRPIYYDLTYFLMFSKAYHPLDILSELKVNNEEVYIDAIILSLKEIKNWSKLYNKIDNDIINKNIKRWKRELNYILRKEYNND